MVEPGSHCHVVEPWRHHQSSLCRGPWIPWILQAELRQILPTVVPHADLSSVWSSSERRSRPCSWTVTQSNAQASLSPVLVCSMCVTFCFLGLRCERRMEWRDRRATDAKRASDILEECVRTGHQDATVKMTKHVSLYAFISLCSQLRM